MTSSYFAAAIFVSAPIVALLPSIAVAATKMAPYAPTDRCGELTRPPKAPCSPGWHFDRANKTLVYRLGRFNDVLVKFTCLRTDRIVADWAYASDDRDDLWEKTKGSIKLYASDKAFIDKMDISGKIRWSDEIGWRLEDLPTTAEGIIFGMIWRGGEITVKANKMEYVLKDLGSKDLNSFRAYCGS